MKKPYFLLTVTALWLLAACAPQPVLGPATGGGELSVIALGSCNDQDRPQPLWDEIAAHRPGLWVWLGDNVYADTDDAGVFREKYDRQLAQPGYAALRRTTPVIGTWDDHDYGVNDGGAEWHARELSKGEMLRFLAVPEDDPVRSRPGVYSAHRYGAEGRRVAVILLDARWWRDPLERPGGVYAPNETGDILGEAQWAWLAEELAQPAELLILGSGIQFLPEEHPYEKWANFPAARQRLFTMLEKAAAGKILLVSGDRHLAEMSALTTEGGRQLTEMTTSGLTHAYRGVPDEPNRHRIGPLVPRLNFGIVRIDWTKDNPAVELEIRGEDNILYHHIKL